MLIEFLLLGILIIMVIVTVLEIIAQKIFYYEPIAGVGLISAEVIILLVGIGALAITIGKAGGQGELTISEITGIMSVVIAATIALGVFQALYKKVSLPLALSPVLLVIVGIIAWLLAICVAGCQ